MDHLLTFATFSLLGAPLAVSLIGLLGGQENAKLMRRSTSLGSVISLVSALVLAAGVISTGSVDRIFGIVGDPQSFHFSVGVWIDRLSLLSVLLITSIGLIVQRYSLRYLEGDKKQGRFLTWLSFVLSSVTLFVMSRNLLALTLAWFLVSFGVHRLLLHFSDREAAQKAAWRKFVISRIGDVALISALVLTYNIFGTFELKDIFQIATTHGAWDPIFLFGLSLNPCALVGSLYVIGAMTKSAQFPFHIWLPDTMETPTPVSALMHAGIINAGGFLIVRLSPIVSHASFALHVLFALGALTALFGGLIYLVQTDIKRSLAYSTISQMGYMMMQCGLGAFGAAVLHLIMHGFYKAQAFLSAGSRIDTTPFPVNPKNEAPVGLPLRLRAGLLSLFLVGASVSLFQIDLEAKAGGLFLCLFLWVSATQALAPALRMRGGFTPIMKSSAFAFLAICFYWISLGALSQFLEPVFSLNGPVTTYGELSPLLVGSVGALFLLVYVLVELSRSSQQVWAKQFYVLCLNHFYVEQAWKRTLSRVFGSSKKIPSFESLAIAKPIGTKQ